MKTHLGRIVSLSEVRLRLVRPIVFGGSEKTKRNSLCTNEYSEVDGRSDGQVLVLDHDPSKASCSWSLQPEG